MITIRDNVEQELLSESCIQKKYRMKLGEQVALLQNLQLLSDLCGLPVDTLHTYFKLGNGMPSKDGYTTYKEALLDQYPELFL